MRKIRWMSAILATALLAAPCAAATIFKFRYDALGRVVIADQAVTSGSGHAGVYTYDAASNRAGVDVSVVVRAVWLPSNVALYRGQSIISQDGRFRFTFQRDGNAVLFDVRGRQLWATNTAGLSGNGISMQSDGNLVVYSAGGSALWSSGTSGKPGAQLAVQVDGNLVIYQNSVPVWAIGACSDCS